MPGQEALPAMIAGLLDVVVVARDCGQRALLIVAPLGAGEAEEGFAGVRPYDDVGVGQVVVGLASFCRRPLTLKSRGVHTLLEGAHRAHAEQLLT